jgi:hypothetical protein
MARAGSGDRREGKIVDRKNFESNLVKYLESMTYEDSIRLESG